MSESDLENLRKQMIFDKRNIFTPKPQPIIKMMGINTKEIVCGRQHVLALTTNCELYVWGSNESGQLGLSKKKTEKQIEFLTYKPSEGVFTPRQNRNKKEEKEDEGKGDTQEKDDVVNQKEKEQQAMPQAGQNNEVN